MEECERRSGEPHDGDKGRNCEPEPGRNDAKRCPKAQLRQCYLQHRITPELSRAAKRRRLE